MTTPARPRCIDLFAGAGGLSLGFEQAGFDIVAAVEIDPVHCATHAFNFPYGVTVCSSVVDLSGATLRKRAGLTAQDEIDVVVGGAPCQGFSMIGKRALDDPRNQLVFHYVRLISELKPRYCVFENVRGLTLGQHKNFLDELIAALGEAGYQITLPYQVLNAADFGVPQDRRRLFLLGTRNGLKQAKYPNRPCETVTVWDAIGDLPDADQFEVLRDSDEVFVTWKTTAPYARQLRGLDLDSSDFSYPRIFDTEKLTSSLRTEHTPLSQTRFSETAVGKTEPISRFRKLPPDGLCHTLRAGTDSARGAFTSPRPIHPVHSRVITVREAARLHGYPDWFRFHVTKWHGFRQIGNSVPPPLARAVAREIMGALGREPMRTLLRLEKQDPEMLRLDMGGAARHFQVARSVIAQRQRQPPKNPRQPSLWGSVNV